MLVIIVVEGPSAAGKTTYAFARGDAAYNTVYPNVASFFGRSGIRSASDVAGRLLREAGVVTVQGEGFGTKEHIRLSYAASAHELDRAIERMRDFFAKL